MSATPSARPLDSDIGLANLLLWAAENHAHSGAYLASREQSRTEFLSYPALLAEARHILGGLQRSSLQPRSKVALLLDQPRDFMPAFWACILGGYVACPLTRTGSDAERWAKHVGYVNELLDQPLFLTTDSLIGELPSSMRSARLGDLRKTPSHESVYPSGPADAAVLMLTSGSTGNSKAVELTHGNILASMAAKAERQQWAPEDIAFNWVGFDHVAALLEAHMIALYVGAGQVHVEPAEVLADPLLFLRLIDRHRVSVTFAPNFLFGQINGALQSNVAEAREPVALNLDLSCLRRILTGGEANVVRTGLRFLDFLAPYGLARNVLCPIYGLTETCAAVVYSLEFPDLDLERDFATVGLPVQGLELRIAGESGKSLPEGESGEVQVRSPIVFARYYNNEEATRAAFTDDGWFRTGDLGHIDAGRLTIGARIKDSIIVNGVNYFSHELEAQLQQLEGIERSFVAAFPTRPQGADTEQLVVTFATSLPPDDEAALYQLVVAVRNTTIMLWGFRPAIVLPLPKGAFPKTSLGKIQRPLIRKRVESGVYENEVARMARIATQQLGAYVAPQGPLETTIAEIYSSILGVDHAALSATVSFFDLGGTSLDILKLTQALERRCGAKLAVPTIIQNPSAQQLAARISAAQSGSVKYDPIVVLQSTGKKTPLFCVHPGNSEILVLINVAKYFLGDRPFYAFRPRGFTQGEACFETLDEIVSTYVNALLARQPQGPYAIAGYSLGALIAFEITKVLEGQGHEVAFLGLIDYRPRYEVITVGFTQIATAVAWVLELIDVEECIRIRAEIPDAPESLETCEYILRNASQKRLAELDIDLQKFFAWSRVAYSTERIVYSHVTSGKVNALTVFCSSGQAGYAVGEDWRQPLERWSEFSVQPPRFIEVAGDHYSLMLPKHVSAFQAQLRAEIDLAMGKR